MRTLIAFGLISSGIFLAQAQADDPQKDQKADTDVTRLLGAYRIVAGEKNGLPISEDRLKDVTVRIASNAITTYDKDKKEVYAATYVLNTGRKPWRISMTSSITPINDKAAKAEGLIDVDGETARLIYALPGGQTPTEFKTGDSQQMFVLKKLEKTSG